MSQLYEQFDQDKIYQINAFLLQLYRCHTYPDTFALYQCGRISVASLYCDKKMAYLILQTVKTIRQIIFAILVTPVVNFTVNTHVDAMVSFLEVMISLLIIATTCSCTLKCFCNFHNNLL